ncbi:MAG: hypothetical protein M1829_001571 [Trizodia sp. TS-e1964]|nr:MAG: hypothetical protein M1829_001571 [Trizodia sp. TS-e1964]
MAAQPTEKEKALRGDLYYAFTPELMAERAQCADACRIYNEAVGISRRRRIELWNQITQDKTPLPPLDPKASVDDDYAALAAWPWVEAPFKADYGINLYLGQNVFINFNCVVLDTCAVRIGSRTLIGPNVNFYAGMHPLEPEIRNGTSGPELGKEISVGDDCWIGGNVTILPGVSIGRGSTIGAGSVVTRDIPPFHVAAGNPAKLMRKLDTTLEDEEGAEPGPVVGEMAEGGGVVAEGEGEGVGETAQGTAMEE